MSAAAIDAPAQERQLPGRGCPLHYRYRPEVFATGAPAALQGLEVLYVVGGLYGNGLALERVLTLFDRESGRKRVVFNGDFHWFDADPEVFARVQRAILAEVALRGNVETELANEGAGADAGCGCAYPDWVGDDVVERSNRIIARLRRARTAAQRAQLAALPMWLRADVGDLRLGIVHGDAQSLAGWGFAQEHLRDAAHRDEVRGWLGRASVDAFARVRVGASNVHVDAIAVEIDDDDWQCRFIRQWPEGSDAHASYFNRITRGWPYQTYDAIRIEE